MRAISMMLALIVAVLLAAGGLQAAQECGSTAVKVGCVGDTLVDPTCVPSYSATHTVTADDVAASKGNKARFCLLATSSSLCPNTSAIATITRNGGGAQTGDLNDGDTLRISAREGDVLQITVVQEARNNGVVCFRLGDVQFQLVR